METKSPKDLGQTTGPSRTQRLLLQPITMAAIAFGIGLVVTRYLSWLAHCGGEDCGLLAGVVELFVIPILTLLISLITFSLTQSKKSFHRARIILLILLTASFVIDIVLFEINY